MEPILTSFPQPPMSPAPKPPFDKSKLLIPGAILVAGLLVSSSVLFARLGTGQALIGGPQQTAGPVAPVEVDISGAPMLGQANAPITVIEFGDFQCPFCERYFKDTEASIIRDYVQTGKVKFIWKDYAFLGPESTRSAEAAR